MSWDKYKKSVCQIDDVCPPITMCHQVASLPPTGTNTNIQIILSFFQHSHDSLIRKLAGKKLNKHKNWETSSSSCLRPTICWDRLEQMKYTIIVFISSEDIDLEWGSARLHYNQYQQFMLVLLLSQYGRGGGRVWGDGGCVVIDSSDTK